MLRGDVLTRQMMSPSQGFRNAKPAAGGEDDLNAPGQVDPVARRDKDGFNPLPRPQGGPYFLSLPLDPLEASPGSSRGDEIPQEGLLCTADRWDVEPESQVGGEAEAPGMGNPLALVNHYVRSCLESVHGLDEDWTFPKAQESGDIGE